jgi:uncharacterized membrane protein
LKSTAPVVLKNILAVAELEHRAFHERSPMERITDAITEAAGTLTFVGLHAVIFAVWIGINMRNPHPFDPFPFSLLNVAVSLEAIFLTSFVLMTQSRMTQQGDKRAHLDLQVNLLAEQELTTMLHMLHALCQRAGVKVNVRDERVAELLKETDIQTLAVALEQNLSDREANPSPERTE